MTIAILISLCSKNQKWQSLNDCDFISVFLDSLIMTKSNRHKFHIYLGYDDNDEFFSQRHEELRKRYNTNSESSLQLTICVLPATCNGNPCKGWNILYEKALENLDNDYFYQCGSDIVHTVMNWDDYFVKLMKKNNDDAIIGGVDPVFWLERQIRDQAGILENVFTGRKHYERFGWFFPPEVKTWFSDDLITKIYRNVNKCFVCPNIKYLNTNRVGGENSSSRYVPPDKEKIAKEWHNYANKYTELGFPDLPKDYLKKPIYN